MCFCSVTILPVGVGTSVSRTIARTIRVLDNFPALNCQPTPMSTQMEGSLKEIMQAVKAMHEEAFKDGAQRVYTIISLDDRRDKKSTLADRAKFLAELK